MKGSTVTLILRPTVNVESQTKVEMIPDLPRVRDRSGRTGGRGLAAVVRGGDLRKPHVAVQMQAH